MTKTNVTIISLLLGLAVVLGLGAGIRTTGLATQEASARTDTVAARQQRLDRMQAQLQHALTSRPPALPAASAAGRAVAAPRVVYVRPTATVTARSSFDDEDRGGQGLDDGDHEREGADD